MNPVIVVVVQLVFLQCWLKSRLLSEETQTHSPIVVKRIFSNSNRKQLRSYMFNLCPMKCLKAGGLGQVLINCSQKCLKLRKRRSLQSPTKGILSLPVNNTTLPRLSYGKNVWLLQPSDDISKLKKIITQDPFVPPPTLSPILRRMLGGANNYGCPNAIYQTSNNSPSPSGENKNLPLLVNVTFRGGNHGPWQAIASWKYNLTEKKRTRNITGYMVFWNSDSFPTGLNCRKLPQNQTMINIGEDDGWMYPDVLYLTVQPIPTVEKKDLELTAFSPKGGVKTTARPSWPIKPGVKTTARPSWPIKSGVKTTARPSWSIKPGVKTTARPVKGGDKTTARPSLPIKLTHNLPLILSLICTGVIVVLLVACLLLRPLIRQMKRSELTQSLSEADVFISYSRANVEWVTENLLRLMERHNISYLIDYKDFVPGKPWIDTMIDCIQRSRKILIVMSNEYMNRTNCKAELDHATYWDRGGKRLIVLRINNVNKDTLPDSIRNRTFIDYADKTERKTWKMRLVSILKISRQKNTLLWPQVSNTRSRSERSVKTYV